MLTSKNKTTFIKKVVYEWGGSRIPDLPIKTASFTDWSNIPTVSTHPYNEQERNRTFDEPIKTFGVTARNNLPTVATCP